MIRIGVILLFFFFAGLKPAPEDIPSEGNTCMNYILISGETNISNFRFSQSLNWSDEFFITEDFIQDQHQETHHIHIPVKNFETENPFMYKDFLDLLKVNQYPEITIGIRNQIFNHMISTAGNLSPEINITLAGHTKSYRIPCEITGCSENSYYLSGRQKIKLTDFNLEPPVKSLGLIKVKNEVIINFGFRFMVNKES